MTSDERAVRRARRLLRGYPPAWRARYGEEFVQLLVDDISDRPYAVRRTVDVLAHAALARFTATGLVADGDDPDARLRAGLGSFGLALVAFAALGVAVWAQLTIDWQWAAPPEPATRAAMLLMTVGAAALGLLGVLGLLPLLWRLCLEVIRSRRRDLAWRLAVSVIAGVVLATGSVHFGRGWPGTGGHVWPGRDLVPAALARACWAATLWETSYWAHPGALASFPTGEVVWMAVGPTSLLAMLSGLIGSVRRLHLTQPILRFELWLGAGSALAMIAFLAGAGSWVVAGHPGSHGLFRTGAIDGIALAVMTGVFLTAFGALARMLGRPRPTAGVGSA